MSAETFTLMSDAWAWNRELHAECDRADRMEDDAAQLFRRAESLRCEAEEVRSGPLRSSWEAHLYADALAEEASSSEARGNRQMHEAKAVRRKKGSLSECVKCFLVLARYHCHRLFHQEREMLDRALDAMEYDPHELIHLGLLHALPVPHELFPPMRGRRAA
jgi:hypothetical protein